MKKAIMKTTIAVLITLFSTTIHSICQTAASNVMTTAGGEFKNADITLSWTLGETVIETNNNSNHILTQGFNQTKIIITAIPPIIELNYSIVVFPNPVSDVVHLKTDLEKTDQMEYILSDIKGTVLERKYFLSNDETLNIQSLSSGIYFIQVLNSTKIVRTFKIVKP